MFRRFILFISLLGIFGFIFALSPKETGKPQSTFAPSSEKPAALKEAPKVMLQEKSEVKELEGVILRSGGPDDYGYWFKDETEPGGPVYNWIDTSGATQTNIVGDDARGSITLPFNFNYYGQSYNTIWVCTNGCSLLALTQGQMPIIIPRFRTPEYPIMRFMPFGMI
uniref:Uncharacterized protein n=1 Tax=candidate division WOR-3 bacterium TaxID=2052148 RepID=A0A7C3UX06_UNCW3